MGRTIASRRAGLSLLTIVALLLVPLGLFGFSLVSEAEKDIALLDKELAGVKLADHAAPYLFGKGAATQASDTAAMERLEREIFGTRSDLRFADLVAGDHTTGAASRAQVERAESYINDVLVKSGLILDSDEETNFVITSLLSNLPTLVNGYAQVVARLQALSDAGSLHVASQDMRNLLITMGRAVEALDRLEQSIASASAASADPEAYKAMQAIVDHFAGDIKSLQQLIVNAVQPGGAAALQSFIGSHAGVAHPIGDTAELWTLATARVEGLLEARLGSLRRQTRLLMILGFVSTLIAVGYALLMFRTTLNKLDEVETARKAEAAARVEAEGMAAKLAGVNHEMAALNRDLSANLTRLKEAQDELLKKGRMEQLGQLTATIAHELRNPLGAVRTSTFLLERKIAGKGLGLETQVERINTGVTRCDNIITQLLDFSRTQKLTLKPGLIDNWLVAVVEEAARRLPAAVQVECVLGLDGVEVPFDAARLERAVTNMIVNAAEALVGKGDDPGKFATPHPKISVSTYRRNGFVAIEVRDNGRGITPDNLAKVREPLFTTKNFGTGLGVPAIEQIASQHDGRLDIQSAPGEGAVFTVWLPYHAATGEAA